MPTTRSRSRRRRSGSGGRRSGSRGRRVARNPVLRGEAARGAVAPTNPRRGRSGYRSRGPVVFPDDGSLVLENAYENMRAGVRIS